MSNVNNIKIEEPGLDIKQEVIELGNEELEYNYELQDISVDPLSCIEEVAVKEETLEPVSGTVGGIELVEQESLLKQLAGEEHRRVHYEVPSSEKEDLKLFKVKLEQEENELVPVKQSAMLPSTSLNLHELEQTDREYGLKTNEQEIGLGIVIKGGEPELKPDKEEEELHIVDQEIKVEYLEEHSEAGQSGLQLATQDGCISDVDCSNASLVKLAAGQPALHCLEPVQQHSTENNTGKHQLIDEGGKSYQCIGSEEIFFKCDICSIYFARADILDKHILKHIGEKALKCTGCSFECQLIGDLKIHMLHHRQNSYNCTKCSFKCQGIGDLKSHMKRHRQNPYKCTQCSYGCKKAFAFKRHMLKHRKNPYRCTECSFECRQACSLNQHKEICSYRKCRTDVQNVRMNLDKLLF